MASARRQQGGHGDSGGWWWVVVGGGVGSGGGCNSCRRASRKFIPHTSLHILSRVLVFLQIC